MDLLRHLVYEYQKGVRNLILYTCPVELIEQTETVLMKHKINYITYYLEEGGKVNVFFGDEDCLEVIQEFSTDDLSKLTPEEDFMLGIMLGYSKKLQYRRYLDIKQNVNKA